MPFTAIVRDKKRGQKGGIDDASSFPGEMEDKGGVLKHTNSATDRATFTPSGEITIRRLQLKAGKQKEEDLLSGPVVSAAMNRTIREKKVGKQKRARDPTYDPSLHEWSTHTGEGRGATKRGISSTKQ